MSKIGWSLKEIGKELNKGENLLQNKLEQTTDAGYPEYLGKPDNFVFGTTPNMFSESSNVKLLNNELYLDEGTYESLQAPSNNSLSSVVYLDDTSLFTAGDVVTIKDETNNKVLLSGVTILGKTSTYIHWDSGIYGYYNRVEGFTYSVKELTQITLPDSPLPSVEGYGDNEIVNGTFDTDLTGWSVSTFSQAGGKAVSGVGGDIKQLITGLTIGNRYYFEYTINPNGATTQVSVLVRNSADSSTLENKEYINGGSSDIKDTITFTATETSHYIRLFVQDTSGVTWDNISVREVLGTTTTQAYSKTDLVVLDRPNLIVEAFTTKGGGTVTPITGGYTITANGNAFGGGTYNANEDFMDSNTEYVISFDVSNLVGNGLMWTDSKVIDIDTNGRYVVPYDSTNGQDLEFSGDNDGTFSADFTNIEVKQKDEIYQATRDTVDMYDYDDNDGIIDVTADTVLLCTGTNTTGIVGHYYKWVYSTQNQNLALTPLNDTLFWEDLGTDSTMSLLNPYFQVKTDVLVNDVVLNRSNISTGAKDVHAYRSLNTYGYDNINHDIMITEGYGLVAGSNDTYTDGTYYLSLIGYVPRLNQGAYHPVYNPYGSGATAGHEDSTIGYQRPWNNTNSKNAKSVADCFSIALTGGLGGVLSTYPTTGSIGTNTVAPHGKFYNQIYSTGLNGLVDRRFNTRLYSKQEVINKSDGIIRDLREGYGTSFIKRASTSTGVSNGGFIFMEGFSPIHIPKGTKLYSENAGYGVVAGVTVIDIPIGYDFSVGIEIDVPTPDRTNDSYILAGKSNLCIQGDQLANDVIGDPANYPQEWLDVLAEGKALPFNPLLVGQDGTSYIVAGALNAILSNKATGLTGSDPVISSLDNGVTWSSGDRITDAIGNYVDAFNASTRLYIWQYLADIDPIHSATPLPLKMVDDKAYGSNSHSIYKLGDYTRAITGKVPVGTSAGGLEQKVLENVILWTGEIDLEHNAGDVTNITSLSFVYFTGFNSPDGVFQRIGGDLTNYNPSSSTDFDALPLIWDRVTYGKSVQVVPTHSTINLNSDDSSAAKFYKGVAKDGNNQAVLQLQGKEMVWDYTSDTAGEFTAIDVGTSTAYTAGNYYRLRHVDFGSKAGLVVYCVSSFSDTADNISRFSPTLSGAKEIQKGDGVTVFEIWDGNGFGDNDNFDNSTTDLNGNTIANDTFAFRLPMKIKD